MSNIQLSKEGDIAILTFDRPDSAANVFDQTTMEELETHLKNVSKSIDIKGLILTSAKPSIFIAGADINEILKPGIGEEDLRRAVERGQQVFSFLEKLGIPTVAAIHGACLGGGYELCLACRHRIASDDKSTKIGLPETSLGILPAWGGSTRLPRLVGLPKALDLILGGKRCAAKKAWKMGMVDEVMPKERLLARAQQLIQKGKRKRKHHVLTNNWLTARIIEKKVRPTILKKTNGHYPAVELALDVVLDGITKSTSDAMKLEADAFVKLAPTSVCQNLVRIFFLQERAKRITVVEEKQPPINAVQVVGAGIMGAGIAQWASARGHRVLLKDIHPEALNKGMAAIGKVYGDATKRRVFTKTEMQAGLDRIQPIIDQVPMRAVDMVIEAAVENMDIKKKIFAELAAAAGDEPILATNTSALSISELAESVPHPERVVGVHFFNPVHRMQLVEVVKGAQTSPEVLQRSVQFVQKLGKLPVVVQDRPGFLVNRILMPYLIEAGHLFAHGADVEKLDQCMLDFGMPMGPMRLMDEVGVDVCEHVASFFATQFGDRMPIPALLKEMVEQEQLGRKTGGGFYVYRKKKKELVPNEKINALVKHRDCAYLSETELQERMVLLMVNEGGRCLEESVVADPRDVDFGMIMGTGFAPFRGGPLRYADAEGIEKIHDRLLELSEKVDPRFAPCERIKEMKQNQQPFYHP